MLWIEQSCGARANWSYWKGSQLKKWTVYGKIRSLLLQRSSGARVNTMQGCGAGVVHNYAWIHSPGSNAIIWCFCTILSYLRFREELWILHQSYYYIKRKTCVKTQNILNFINQVQCCWAFFFHFVMHIPVSSICTKFLSMWFYLFRYCSVILLLNNTRTERSMNSY